MDDFTENEEKEPTPTTDSVSRSSGATELISEAQVAHVTLRFSVGDAVNCRMNDGWAEGEVIKRFYREDDWPRGYYAAVRCTHSNHSSRSL